MPCSTLVVWLGSCSAFTRHEPSNGKVALCLWRVSLLTIHIALSNSCTFAVACNAANPGAVHILHPFSLSLLVDAGEGELPRNRARHIR